MLDREGSNPLKKVRALEGDLPSESVNLVQGVLRWHSRGGALVQSSFGDVSLAARVRGALPGFCEDRLSVLAGLEEFFWSRSGSVIQVNSVSGAIAQFYPSVVLQFLLVRKLLVRSSLSDTAIEKIIDAALELSVSIRKLECECSRSRSNRPTVPPPQFA
jgi:hypothetical protein